jgi:Ca2+-binding RTX toxin-like protein
MPAPSVLTAAFKVFTNVNDESEPVIVAGLDGRFGIYWSAVTGTQSDVLAYNYVGTNFGPNGAGSTSAQTVTSSAIEANPDAATLISGNLVVAYEKIVGDNRDIYFDIRAHNGDGTYTPFVTSRLVNTAATSGDQFQPEVVSLADSRFYVAWEDNQTQTINVQRYDFNGGLSGGLFSFACDALQTSPSANYNFDLIGLAGGGFAVSYAGTSAGVACTKVSAVSGSGTAIVTNLAVSAGTSGNNFEAAMAQSASGNIAFAFSGNNATDAVVRIMSSSFAPLTGDIVLTNAANSGQTPRIAAMLDGRFMAVYSSLNAGPLYGQMINADGTLDGAAFIISASGHQSEVETLADGRVVVTWREGGAGAGDIYSAMYDPREAGVDIFGTPGNDNYVGSQFGDTLTLLTGNDFILANGGADLIDGDEGNDTLYGGSGNNTINGGEGFDLIVGGVGDELLRGGPDNDTIFGEAGNDRIFAGSFTDLVAPGAGNVLIGGSGNDTLYGAETNDYFYGGLDGDSMEGNGGIDVLIGEGGSDTMRGGDGNDVFYSGDGVNLMYGDAGDDVFISEGGSDLIEGGIGHNYYYRVAAGASQINGGTGIDEFVGGSAASGDAFYGNDGNDYAFGGNGDDVLVGQLGNDVLIGQNGNDTLEGGAGVNLLWANDVGSDEIRVVVSDGGTQVVEFFEAGGVNDVVRLLGSTLTSFAGIQNLVSNIGVAQGANIMYNTGSGAQLYLNLGASQTAIWFQGVSAYSLTSADFLFV